MRSSASSWSRRWMSTEPQKTRSNVPELLGRRVVDAAVDALDLRAADLLGQPEAVAARAVRELATAAAAAASRGRARRRGPARPPRGAAALHLERPEAVPGADVQDAHAVHPLGQPVVVYVWPQVEPAVGDLVAEVHDVVPALVAHALEKGAVGWHGAQPSGDACVRGAVAAPAGSPPPARRARGASGREQRVVAQPVARDVRQQVADRQLVVQVLVVGLGLQEVDDDQLRAPLHLGQERERSGTCSMTSNA